MADDANARNRLHVDERRSQLVALALELFADRGYDDISIGEFAKAAGISKGLLYHYFPSKRAFFAAAVREAARQLLDETAGDHAITPTSEAPNADELNRRVSAYLAFVEKRSASYVFLLRGRQGDDEMSAIVDETRQAFIDRIGEGIAALTGGPVDERARIAIRGWIGFVEAASLAWLEEGAMPRDELAQMLVQVCIATVELALRPLG